MSKFDVKVYRANVSVLAPLGQEWLLAACDHIDAMEARIAKLEKMREAARRVEQEHHQLHLRLREALRDALAACDDGERATTPTPDETLASWHDEARGDPIPTELVNTENVRSLLTALKGAIAERDELKAQLDVAVDTLHDVCDHHAGERSCRSVYNEPYYGLCDCHVDQARAALAKIKETAKEIKP